MIGGMVAGWSIHNATDPTRVEPIAVPNDIEFKSGDIIVAGGVSLQSRLVLALTEDNQYSHVGLIQATPLGLFVIHAAPNGAGDGGVGDKVARIPLSLFLAERGYVAVQVMRLKSQTAEAQELAQDACDFAMACAEQDVPFDSDYDLADDRTVYCSELIYLAYKQAGETWPDTLIGHYDNLMEAKMKNLLTLMLLTCSLALVGCGGGTPAPGDTVKEFAYAMEAGDADKVKEVCPQLYALLGDEKLATMVNEGSEDMKSKGGIKSITIDKEEVSEDGKSAKVTATVESGDGEKNTDDFDLELRDDKWIVTLDSEGKGGAPEIDIDLNAEEEILVTRPALAEMESALLNHIANADLRGTKVSVSVMDVGQGLMLTEINDQREMIPASNMKLITSAAALYTLGKDFTFSTQLKLLGSKEAPAGDGLPALVIKGDGDPAFGSPDVLQEAGYSVERMVGWWLGAVEKAGLDQFGQIIVDDRIFDASEDQRVHPTWPRNQLHKWYCAQVMGVNFFDNCFRVNASPTRTGQDARVTVYPYGPFLKTEMRLVTGRADQWDIITAHDNNRIAFRGQIRNRQKQDVAMHDPAIVFGEFLKHELGKRGITVGQVVRPADDQRLPEGTTLHKINTTLQAVLNRVNTDSQNMYSEALLKRCGHAITGAPGTFENGAAAVREYLAKRINDPTLAASIKLADGSGLSRDNKVSTRALVEVLRVQATSQDFRPYLASMATPDNRDSIERRFTKDGQPTLVADLYCKTGTINHVSALSGYLVYNDAGQNNTARVLAFSIIANGHGLGQARNISGAQVRKLQNELVQIIDQEAVGELVP
eukprot:g12462.t1